MTNLLVINQMILLPSQGGLWKKYSFKNVDELVNLLSKFLPRGSKVSIFWSSTLWQRESELLPPMKAKDQGRVLGQRRGTLEDSGLGWSFGDSRKRSDGGEQVVIIQETVPFWLIAKERLERSHKVILSAVIPWDFVCGSFPQEPGRCAVTLAGDASYVWLWARNSHGELAAFGEEQTRAGWARIREWMIAEGISLPDSPAMSSSILALALTPNPNWKESCPFWNELSEQNVVKLTPLGAVLKAVPLQPREGRWNLLRSGTQTPAFAKAFQKVGFGAVAASVFVAIGWWFAFAQSQERHHVGLKRIRELRLQLEKRKSAENEARQIDAIYGKAEEVADDIELVPMLRLLGAATPSFASLDFFDWQKDGPVKVSGSVWKLAENDTMEKWMTSYASVLRKDAPGLIFEVRKRINGERDSQFVLTSHRDGGSK